MSPTRIQTDRIWRSGNSRATITCKARSNTQPSWIQLDGSTGQPAGRVRPAAADRPAAIVQTRSHGGVVARGKAGF